MSTIDIKATWHKESYDRFLNEQLPHLLSARLPLAGYQVEPTDLYTCCVRVAIVTDSGHRAEVIYQEIPQPDAHGLFLIKGQPMTVVPLASSEDLDTAEVLCVGDMLYAMLQARLGDAPPDLPWSETLLRTWLPLDTWIGEHFTGTHAAHLYDPYFQRLDSTNWLAQRTHLRRLFMNLSDPKRVITAGQFGRLCPYEKPEGPNLGRIGVIARGATIRDKKVVIEDPSDEAAVGLSMSVIPLVEHTDANRLLMGANMLRQWLPYDQPEPALVQTGNEPVAPEFWCGRNLLTAFLSWGADTNEDGIVLSESGARHLSNPDHQVEPGDKLSNRFGMKGVVSRILPDEKMPKLADGTAVEAIFSSVGLHSRLTLGQLWEAVLGRLARAEGEPIIAPPFHGPAEAEVKRRLAAAGLPVDGMEHLRHGESDTPLPQPSLAGWLYWGRTDHLVRDKLRVTADALHNMQRNSELEFQMLSQIGAVETIREHFHTRATFTDISTSTLDESVESVAPQQSGLAAAIAAGIFDEPKAPAPRFRALQSRLAAAGIDVTLTSGKLRFSLDQPTGDAIQLAQPVPHPWLNEHLLQSIGAPETGADNHFPYTISARRRERQLSRSSDTPRLPEYEAVMRANDKLSSLLASNAPSTLKKQAFAQLEARIQLYFHILLNAEDMHFDSRVLFSGRTVLAPGDGLSHEQVGLADEMAWTLFAPQTIYQLNSEGRDGNAEVTQRTPRAAQTLDEIMARSWLIVHRIPTVRPTAMIAFHPVRIPEKVVRIPAMACLALDADFDGDQASVFLPITVAGQREAGERLSLAGHLERDPEVLNDLAPFRDPMLGLAMCSLQPAGRDKIIQIVGADPDFSQGFLTRKALIDRLKTQLASKGAKAVLEALDQLIALGFATLKATGVSLSPFLSLGLEMPMPPPTDRPDLWESYMQQRVEQILAVNSYEDGWGHYLLAAKCGALAENRLRSLALLTVARGVVTDVAGRSVVIPQSFRTGLPSQAHFATVAGAQTGMRNVVQAWEESGTRTLVENRSKSFYVLARARRAVNPGIVFARSAAMGEVDPLVDEESRFFVGVR